MFTVLFWLMLAVTVLEWTATWREWQRVRWFSKPGAMILLIAWFTQVGGWQGPLLWFGLGLVLSLAGDIFLLFSNRFFLPGLAAFLLAHLATLVGLTREPLAASWTLALPVVLIGGVFGVLNGMIRTGLKQKGEINMQAPVMVYASIISVMWLMAISTLFRPIWQPIAAIMVSLGAGLFFVSDSILAFNRFVRPTRHGNLLVMVSYLLAQILITSGVLTQYVR